jgi:hypothetical protein
MRECECCSQISGFGPYIAARYGHVRCLEIFKLNNDPMFDRDRDILAMARNAAYGGQLTSLEWLHINGYSHLWNSQVLSLAERYGDEECIKYIKMKVVVS